MAEEKFLHLPFAKSTYFVDRGEKIKTVEEHLAKHNIAILIGDHGVGKTCLAIEYAYAASKKNIYETIWFVNGKNLDGEYLRFSARLGEHCASRIETIERAKSNLQKQKCLLIIDGVENYKLTEPYLLQTSSICHLIITTHQQSAWEMKLNLPLEVFQEDDAIKYFMQIIKCREYENEKKKNINTLICNVLKRVPLAITLVGAFIVRTYELTREPIPLLVSKYIRLFKNKSKQFPSNKFTGNLNLQIITVICDIALDAIKDPRAKVLLLGISCLMPAPAMIPQYWLSGFIEQELDRIDVLGELKSYLLIEAASEKQNYFLIHSLIQEAIFKLTKNADKKKCLGNIHDRLHTHSLYQISKDKLEIYEDQISLQLHSRRLWSLLNKILTEEKYYAESLMSQITATPLNSIYNSPANTINQSSHIYNTYNFYSQSPGGFDGTMPVLGYSQTVPAIVESTVSDSSARNITSTTYNGNSRVLSSKAEETLTSTAVSNSAKARRQSAHSQFFNQAETEYQQSFEASVKSASTRRSTL